MESIQGNIEKYPPPPKKKNNNKNTPKKKKKKKTSGEVSQHQKRVTTNDFS